MPTKYHRNNFVSEILPSFKTNFQEQNDVDVEN